MGAAVAALGVPAEAWARMTAARPALAGAEAGGERPLEAVEAWVVPILGSITAQELAVRVLACRTPAVARGATIAASGLYLIVGLVPVALGLLGAALLPGLAEPEQVIPRLAADLLGPGPRILLYGALVAAILSTVDSNLLSASSLVAHNLVLPRWRSATERQRVLVARIGVVVAGLTAFGLAFSRETVYALVEEASAIGGGGLPVTMTFGLFTRFGGRISAVASIGAGMAVQMVGSYVAGWPHPMTTSVAVALAVYVAVARVERRRAATIP
jgi:Na+/proline symporter